MKEVRVRLQKFMAERGVASRRKSEELIEKGLVKVNGHPAHIGDSVDPRADLVTVQGKRLMPVREMKYIMLNKPRGYITTMSDEMGRKCVAELVADVGELSLIHICCSADGTMQAVKSGIWCCGRAENAVHAAAAAAGKPMRR